MTFTITVVEHSIARFVLILSKLVFAVELQRISGRPFPTKDYVYPRYKRAEALSMLLSGSVTDVPYRKKDTREILNLNDKLGLLGSLLPSCKVHLSVL